MNKYELNYYDNDRRVEIFRDDGEAIHFSSKMAGKFLEQLVADANRGAALDNAPNDPPEYARDT